MFKTILVPTDGTPLSDKAMNAAIELARDNPGSKIIGLSVAEPMPISRLEGLTRIDTLNYDLREQMLAQKHVDKIAEAAKAAGIPCETIVGQSADPHEEIIKVALHYGSDCIFMASHESKGFGKFVKVRESKKVLTHVNVPVLLYR
jgi:nucleotide-binding universal stress UspA family protein